MKIRQQKDIKAFLAEEFGADRASALFYTQEKTLRAMIESERGKSKIQRMTLRETILPCVALYKTLLEEVSKEEAYAYTQKYMTEWVAAKSHASMAKMERVPGFYELYSVGFLGVVRATDLWESEQKRGKGCFEVTITKCLWHTASAEHGCAELCRAFCDVDNVTYGGLRKIGFARTQTLGYGGACCDFRFFRIKSKIFCRQPKSCGIVGGATVGDGAKMEAQNTKGERICSLVQCKFW